MKNKKNKKGFTLAELLIVVAIIAVLVAIAIPIFSSQLEKSRDATDQANVRSAYAELSAALLTNDKTTGQATLTDLGLASPPWSGSLSGNSGTITYTFEGKGTNTNWDNLSNGQFKIGNLSVDAAANANTISFTVASGKITGIGLSQVNSAGQGEGD